MLSQMLLTIPSHLDYVDTYTHNGTASDRTRLIPRLKGKEEMFNNSYEAILSASRVCFNLFKILPDFPLIISY